MESKSKKVQAECLDEIGNMIQKFGLEVCKKPKKTIMLMGTRSVCSPRYFVSCSVFVLIWPEKRSVGISDKGVREAALTGNNKTR
jgi:hypothetical protein